MSWQAFLTSNFGDFAKGEEIADLESLKAFGYLSTRLELLGVNVHKEFAHLTKNEQALVKAEYARAVMDVLNHAPEDNESCISNIQESERSDGDIRLFLTSTNLSQAQPPFS